MCCTVEQTTNKPPAELSVAQLDFDIYLLCFEHLLLS